MRNATPASDSGGQEEELWNAPIWESGTDGRRGGISTLPFSVFSFYMYLVFNISCLKSHPHIHSLLKVLVFSFISKTLSIRKLHGSFFCQLRIMASGKKRILGNCGIHTLLEPTNHPGQIKPNVGSIMKGSSLFSSFCLCFCI